MKMDMDVGRVALQLADATGAGAACCVLTSADGAARARIAAAGVRQVDGGSACLGGTRQAAAGGTADAYMYRYCTCIGIPNTN